MGKPSDFGPVLNGVMWFQVIISSVFIVLRIYTRYYLIRSLGWDDLMMVVNLVRQILLQTFPYLSFLL
jgi:nicotinamide riboside transporter PnuC